MRDGAFGGLESCVHCGFCLQSCPTYRETQVEGDSPRGRILLMRRLAQGELSIADADLVSHLSRCLGCRACEPVCPSGVQYGPALEKARECISEVHTPPLSARLINTAMGEEILRRPLLYMARTLRPLARLFSGGSRLGFFFGMLSATKPWYADGVAGLKDDAPAAHAADSRHQDSSARSVVLFEGCVMSGLFSHVHDATARTLSVNGYNVTRVRGQVCCGALHAHAGQLEQALRLARTNVHAFAKSPSATMAVNSAGCGAMLKDYGRLLAGDPLQDQAEALASRVRDVSELLAETGPRPGKRVDLRVAYDPPCHLLHAQGIADAPLAVLQAVPGVERAFHVDAELCCGSAGSYTFTQSRLSRAILDKKVSAILECNPDIVATGNPGCIMQIGAGLAAAGSTLRVVHPVELLDRSYSLAGYYD